MSYFQMLGSGAKEGTNNNLMIHHNPKLNALAIGDKAYTDTPGYDKSARAFLHIHTNLKLNSVETCSLVKGSNAIGKSPVQPCCPEDPVGTCPFYSSSASNPDSWPSSCGAGSCV